MVSTVAIVMAIIEFGSLIPVVYAWKRRKTVVSGGFGREFHIRLSIAIDREMRSELLTGGVIVIIHRSKRHVYVIIHSEIHLTVGFCVRKVLSGGMVGDEIYYDLQPCRMRAFHKSFEFMHPAVDISGQTWVDVIIILYGVW